MKTTSRPPSAPDDPRRPLPAKARARFGVVARGLGNRVLTSAARRSSLGRILEIEVTAEMLDPVVLRRQPRLRKALLALDARPRRSNPISRAARRMMAAAVTPDIDPSSYRPDARARALVRGKAIIEADLAEAGGAYEAEQARGLLNGISRQALDKRVKDGSVLAVPGPSSKRRYPTLQFGRDGVVPGIKQVQSALPTRNPWAVLNFLINADDRLGGRRPIDVLREGDTESVVAAARSWGLQGG